MTYRGGFRVKLYKTFFALRQSNIQGIIFKPIRKGNVKASEHACYTVHTDYMLYVE